MLTSNHAPMTRSAAAGRVQSVRSAERIRTALEHMEQTHEAELVLLMTLDFGTAEAQAQAEAIYDLLHDDEDAMLAGWGTDEWIDDRTDWLTEQDVEDILADRDDDARLPGSPGWGESRVDYSEFVSGFIVR